MDGIAPLFDEKSRSAGDLTTRGRATHSPPPSVGRNLIYFLLCGNVCGTEKGRGERRRERESRFSKRKSFPISGGKGGRANKGFAAMDVDGNADGIGRGTGMTVHSYILVFHSYPSRLGNLFDRGSPCFVRYAPFDTRADPA